MCCVPNGGDLMKSSHSTEAHFPYSPAAGPHCGHICKRITMTYDFHHFVGTDSYMFDRFPALRIIHRLAHSESEPGFVVYRFAVMKRTAADVVV